MLSVLVYLNSYSEFCMCGKLSTPLCMLKVTFFSDDDRI